MANLNVFKKGICIILFVSLLIIIAVAKDSCAVGAVSGGDVITLADYPFPFNNSGLLVVYGGDATADDVAPAVDIISGLGLYKNLNGSNGSVSIMIKDSELMNITSYKFEHRNVTSYESKHMNITNLNISDYNLIVIGGPAINRVTAQILGKDYPAYGANSGLKENEAIIELKKNGANYALIVAGWEGIDTRRAGVVLSKYAIFKQNMNSTSVVVRGTTLNVADISVG